MIKNLPNLIFLLLFCIYACAQNQPLESTLTFMAATPTFERITITKTPTILNLPVSTPSEVATNRPTQRLIQPTFTATTSPIEGYKALPDGDYIVYYSGHSVGVLSLDSRLQEVLINGYSDISLSPDNKNLYLVPNSRQTPLLINLESMEQEKVPFLKGCFDVSLSPNGNYFLGSCQKEDKSTEIFIFTRDGKRNFQLTSCSNHDANCGVPVFTSDGNWIAYYRGPSGAIQSPLFGLYLVSMKNITFDAPVRIEEKGPFKVSNDCVWAKNSRYLACSGNKFLTLYEWTGENILKVRDFSNIRAEWSDNWLAWSENSDRIAYSNLEAIRVVEILDGKISTVKEFSKDVYILGWVKIENGKVSQ